MSNTWDPNPAETRPRRPSSRPDDWSSLLRCETVEAAVADLGGRGRRWLRELVLVAGDDPDRTLAVWRSGTVVDEEDRAVSASVPGSAGWALRGLLCTGTTPVPNAFADLVSRLAMWHQARKMLAESDVRVVARSAELDLPQVIRRAAA